MYATVGGALVVAGCGVDTNSTAEPEIIIPIERVGELTVPEVPPEVDVTASSVELDRVLFDTFDGGVVPLSESTSQLRSRLLDVIPPIDDPIYTDAAGGEEWLDDSNLVLGLVVQNQAFAYPTKILNYHEIINTDVAGEPLLVSYCPLCRSAVVYERSVTTADGEHVLSFSNTSALYDADMVMVDRETGSYWWQVLGEGIVGPLTGAELTVLPSSMSTWADWVERHPDTVVLSRDTGFTRPYEIDRFAQFADRVSDGQIPFRVDDEPLDRRLDPAALVVIVDLEEVGGSGVVAYDVESLDAVFDDTIDGATLRIVPHDSGADVLGADGTPLPTRTTFWFAAVGAFPDIQIRAPG